MTHRSLFVLLLLHPLIRHHAMVTHNIMERQKAVPLREAQDAMICKTETNSGEPFSHHDTVNSVQEKGAGLSNFPDYCTDKK